ncbi:zinc-binding alcohol dehydrogenase family protein [Nocardia sp. NPDC088792]|uniref:quinone oxidoreductase family protein n=1 Tax=Nocardia sp. NPDC088792 TaxID=3364332 RepID=UPI0038146171
MKAIVLHEPGGPEALRLQEIPVPEADAGQVLVRTEAIGVSFHETLMRAGVFPMPSGPPATFGFEAVGVVTAVGDEVDAGLIGQRVFVMYGGGGQFGSGTYAEYCTAPVATLTPIPEDLPGPDALTLGVQGAVALALFHTAGLTGAENVLIEVAGSGIGAYLTQLVRDRGAHRIVATAGTSAKRDRAKALGADVVVDHTDPAWPEQVRAALGAERLDLVFESLGGPGTELLDTLTPGTGRILLYGLLNGAPDYTPLDLLIRGLTVVGCGGLTGWADRVAAARTEAFALASAGLLTPLIEEVLPLAAAAEAHRRLENRTATGKLVLVP